MEERSQKGLDSSRFTLAWRPLRLFILPNAQYSIMTSYLSPGANRAEGSMYQTRNEACLRPWHQGGRVLRVEIPIKATWLPARASAVCIHTAFIVYPSWSDLLFPLIASERCPAQAFPVILTHE